MDENEEKVDEVIDGMPVTHNPDEFGGSFDGTGVNESTPEDLAAGGHVSDEDAADQAAELIEHGIDPAVATNLDEDIVAEAKVDAGLEEDEAVLPAESSDAEKAASEEAFEEAVEKSLEPFEDDQAPLKLGAYSRPIFHDDAIRVGDIGGQVRMLRAKLAKAGAFRQPDLIEDRDDFDPKMEAAVKAFQRDNDLEQTGEVDAATFSAIRAIE